MTAPGGAGNMRLPEFPLIPPGICGARFLRQQEAGASFFGPAGAGLSRCAPRDAETRSMGLAVAHPISPELVLVCPELREHALRLLPGLDPDELFEVEPAPRPARPPAVRERPRLVVVEPQPRAPLPVAVAAYFGEALVLGAVRGTILIAGIGMVSFLLAR